MKKELSHQIVEIQQSMGDFIDDYLEYTGYSINHSSKVLKHPRDAIYRMMSRSYTGMRLVNLSELCDSLGISVIDLLQYNSLNDFERMIQNNDKIEKG